MNTEKLRKIMNGLEKRGIPSGDLIVYQDHHEVFRYMTGNSDYTGKKALTGNELYYFYSATKMFTCCAILQLMEQGKLELDAPVAQWLPAYEHMVVRCGDTLLPARNQITIRHLMGMQSGLNYNLRSPETEDAYRVYGKGMTTRQFVDALAKVPLDFEPGSDYQYSLSHDVLAAVVEVVSGLSFSEYLKKSIFDPLEITDLSFSVAPERLERMCAQYDRGNPERQTKPCAKTNCFILSEKYESGGAGLNGGVKEYAKFVDALACGGTGFNGAKILEEKTVRLWSTVKSEGKPWQHFNQLRGDIGYTYGLGVRIMEHSNHSDALSPDGEFGWDGAAGAYALVDPVNRLSAFFAMHVLGYGEVYTTLHPEIRDCLYE